MAKALIDELVFDELPVLFAYGTHHTERLRDVSRQKADSRLLARHVLDP
jgi:hypothetical protein